MYDFNELLLTIFFISLLDLIIFIYIMMWVILHSVRNALDVGFYCTNYSLKLSFAHSCLYL